MREIEKSGAVEVVGYRMERGEKETRKRGKREWRKREKRDAGSGVLRGVSGFWGDLGGDLGGYS